MEDILEDLISIYISCINSYSARFHQVLNNKYTLVDKAMITSYLFVKIIEDKKMQCEEATNSLLNYILKQIIYSETGSISLEVQQDKLKLYNEILDSLILEKFKYKNRILRKLKYQYIVLKENPYSNLLIFLEDIAEYVTLERMLSEGQLQVQGLFNNKKNTIINSIGTLDKNDIFYDAKKQIIDLMSKNKFNESEYGELMHIALNIKDVYRFSNCGVISTPENVLFHSYMVTIISILLAEYCNKELNENIDIYKIMVISLLHDFTEYKGTEIIAPFKNYNDITKKMFSEIETADENELIGKIGQKLGDYIHMIKTTKEGYISELIDKMLPIIRTWIEIGYFNNYTFIGISHTIYQDRLKRFLRVEKIDDLNNKSFFLDLLRECYIYTKGHSLEANTEYSLKFYTPDELNEFRKEIELLKEKPETFLI